MTRVADEGADGKEPGQGDEPVRVIHVITGLDVGGAEMAMIRLVEALDRQAFQSSVVSLKPAGELADRLRARDVEVAELGLSPAGLVAGLGALAGLVRHRRADIVQTWMHHGDLVGGLAGRWAGARGVVWGLRASTLDAADVRLTTRCVVRACARLSRIVPDRIVANSRSGARLHAALGYDESRMLVIPNGFDVGAMPDRGASRASVIDELGLPDSSRLVGSFGRFDPQKDFRNLCDAGGRLARTRPEVRFVLAGRGLDSGNAELTRWAADAGLGGRVSLLGLRNDIPRLAAAMDIVTLASSWGEAFPQVVGEAMACGTPCVVTDVGDSSDVVADTGLVVPPQDAAALAGAWERMLAMPAERLASLGARARARIAQEYDQADVAERYAALYRELAVSPRR